MCLEYQAIPLVNTEKLLSFIDTSVDPGEDGEVQFDLKDFKNPDVGDITALVACRTERRDGVPPTCPDFVLCSDKVRSDRAYPIVFNDAESETLATLYYQVAAGAGSKRGAARPRIDYSALRNVKPAGGK